MAFPPECSPINPPTSEKTIKVWTMANCLNQCHRRHSPLSRTVPAPPPNKGRRQIKPNQCENAEHCSSVFIAMTTTIATDSQRSVAAKLAVNAIQQLGVSCTAKEQERCGRNVERLRPISIVGAAVAVVFDDSDTKTVSRFLVPHETATGYRFRCGAPTQLNFEFDVFDFTFRMNN